MKEPDEVGPNQEQAPLVTWGALPSNSPKAKQSAPRQTLLILKNLDLDLDLDLDLEKPGDRLIYGEAL
ncbi:hypothetical protein [Pseudomonas sp. AK106]